MISEFVEVNLNVEIQIEQGTVHTSPILQSGSGKGASSSKTLLNTESVKPKIKITDEDIAEEVQFWKSAMLCYVLGANPPLSVMEGYFRRTWQERINKVGSPHYGFFLVRFHRMED